MAASSWSNPPTISHSHGCFPWNGSEVELCPILESSMDANVRPHMFVELKPSFEVKYAFSSPLEGGSYRLGVLVPDISCMGQGHTAVMVVAHPAVSQRVLLDVVDAIVVDHLSQQPDGFEEESSLGTCSVRLERVKKKKRNIKKERSWPILAACPHLGCTSGWLQHNNSYPGCRSKQRTNSVICGASPQEVATSPKLVSWSPPPLNYVKINFDGSVHSRSSGMGAIIRDHYGHILLAMAVPLSTSSVPYAELMGAWYGLNEAIHLFHPTKVILEGDCSTVISCINGKSKYQHPYLKDLKALISTISQFICSHIYREANQAADYMANWAATRKQMAYWTTNFPPQLLYIVAADARGDVYLRP